MKLLFWSGYREDERGRHARMIYSSDQIKLYHATFRQLMPTIEREGLDSKDPAEPIWLGSTPDAALNHAVKKYYWMSGQSPKPHEKAEWLQYHTRNVDLDEDLGVVLIMVTLDRDDPNLVHGSKGYWRYLGTIPPERLDIIGDLGAVAAKQVQGGK